MSENRSKQIERLKTEHPALFELLRSTPPALNVDTGTASSDEVLIARALSILSAAEARSAEEPIDTIQLTSGELRLMLNAVVDLRASHAAEVHDLRNEISRLRDTQLTDDGVRVLVARMVLGLLGAAAAIGALVAAIVSIA
jgi:hypothetical protein